MALIFGMQMLQNVFFTKNGGSRMSCSYIALVESIDVVNNISWPHLIRKHMMHGIEKSNDDYRKIDGCAFYLLPNFGCQVVNGLENNLITPLHVMSQVEKLNERIRQLQAEVDDQKQKTSVINVKLREMQKCSSEDPKEFEIVRKILEDILEQDKGKTLIEQEKDDSDPHREHEHHIHKKVNNLKYIQNNESGSHREHDPILSQPTQQNKETHVSLENKKKKEEEHQKKMEELAKENEKEEEEQKMREMLEKQRMEEEARKNQELLEQQKREEEEEKQRLLEIQQREQEEREAYLQQVECQVRKISFNWHPNKTVNLPVMEQDELEVKLQVLSLLLAVGYKTGE
ncbi:vicilin-like seed storage protein At2g18540 [Papaver somniferum]|uniref:vicilin-like seed storage protein At2g18540 n=1 Tax=Papaver somniferum TaxID=3469 RepID=UPI000E6FF31A|nr:vicilin-like seed storage protein At2g18540 [Papaver somniferum]